MIEHGLAFLFTVLLWWASTGAIMLLCARPARTFPLSFGFLSVSSIVAGYGLVETAAMTSVAATYLSFLSAIVVWGWFEASFLMGYVTGPSKEPCPVNARGWRRFRLAVSTLLYHELAIVLAAGVIVAVTWGRPNQTGALAFLILAGMRVSAKLNIFLGVPNLSHEFLPARLSYLKSYFRTARYNALLPVSLILGGLVAAGLAERAIDGEGTTAIGAGLLFTLTALALLEHLFMLLPLRDGALWQWAVTQSEVVKPIGKGLS